eukprot:Gb_22187 [translate_table: standard]
MFGLDVYGYSIKKAHVILSHEEKKHPIKKDVPYETNQLNHVYTFIRQSNATYNIVIDNKEKESKSLYIYYDSFSPKSRIQDAKYPED